MGSTWNISTEDEGHIYNAEDLVNERFDQIKGWLEKYEDEWHDAIQNLRDIFSDSNFPNTVGQVENTINYNYIDSAQLDFDIPEMPESPEFNFEKPDKPTKIDDFQTVTLQDIGQFAEALDEVYAPDIDFMTRVYQSGLLDDIKSAVNTLVNQGGTGLGADVEEQIWDRARARKDLQNERAYREAENYFASRGYTLPPGALAGRLFEALQEQTRADNQISAEIGIEQARLAQNMTQHAQQMAVQLEQLDQDTWHKIRQRAYEKARDAAGVIQKAYDQKIAAYQAKVDAHRSKAETERIKAEATAQHNQSIADVYRADVEAYRTQVQAELGIVETLGQIFAAKISGYNAEVEAKTKKLSGQIEQFRARVEQSRNQTSLAIQEAEMLLTKYVEGLRVDSETEGQYAKILSQVVSSLFNAVSVSGSMAEGLSYRKSLNGESDPDVSVHYNFSDR